MKFIYLKSVITRKVSALKSATFHTRNPLYTIFRAMKYIVLLQFIIFFIGCKNSNNYIQIDNDIKILKKESDSLAINKYRDSIKLSKVKPGFYYRKTPVTIEDQEIVFYNEIEWIYISDVYETTFFITANNEGCCIQGLNCTKPPKSIYRQLNKNIDMINSIPIGWCRLPILSHDEVIEESIIIIDTLINNDQFENSLKIQEKLIFQNDGLIRSITNINNEKVLLKYSFIGK